MEDFTMKMEAEMQKYVSLSSLKKRKNATAFDNIIDAVLDQYNAYTELYRVLGEDEYKEKAEDLLEMLNKFSKEDKKLMKKISERS